MYNITFTEPEIPTQPNPEIDAPDSSTSSNVNPIYSETLLAILLVAVVVLWAMNLKDGGRNPRDGGPPDE